MIKRYKWIIHLVLFFISSACGFIQTSNHKRAVENLVNNAGRNGEPVIACLADAYQNLLYNFKQVELRLYNIEGDYVRLAPAQTFNSDTFYNLMFFTTDGMLYMLIENDPYLPDGLNGLNITDKRFASNQPGQYRNLTAYGVPYLSRYVDKSSDIVQIYEDHFTVINRLEGTHDEFEINEPGPLTNGSFPSSDFDEYSLTNDHSKLIIGYDPDHNSGPDGGMWVYDVPSGAWKFLAIPGYVGFKIGTSLDGKSVAFMSHDSFQDFYSTIIDIETGNAEFSQNCSMPDIWQNWVVMKDYARLDPKLKIFDIRNDWREYEFDKPDLDILPGFIFQTFAIYEPPPDGIDGMYPTPE